jgi:hypothetical protein
MMRTSLVLTVLLLSTPLLQAQQQFNPPHLLVRSICVGGNDCATVDALVSRTIPFTGTKSVAGVLQAEGADPILRCVEKLRFMNDADEARCIKERLAGVPVRDALKAQKYDGYLIYILQWDPRGGVHGRAVLLTPTGDRVESPASISQYRSDLSPIGIAVVPVNEQALILTMPDLADKASSAGLFGIPPQHEVAHADSGKLLGSVFVPGAQQP